MTIKVKDMVDGYCYVWIVSDAGDWDKMIVGKGKTRAEAIGAARKALQGALVAIDKEPV